ncbi:MAG TPA: DUF2325 domain-containing protein [Thiolapillus brandeum]|uniref:DUF2325 domain-containing protein n=1 Tax=Thiolapillus brandeum TaxID=1076588 RepID=A0A831NRY6_9GAMM|nr:DUF2325 domain-containing protein [Thiolapillus brandeum]
MTTTNSVSATSKKRASVKGRRKLWELEDRFHCSIVGTCLNLDELRKLGRKLGIPTRIVNNDYLLHSAFVGLIGERSTEARLINKTLDRKYRTTIRQFNTAIDPAQLQKLWQDALRLGEINGAFWALVTHPQANEDLLFDAYGKVHMLSHLSGASIRVDMRQLNRLRLQVPHLEQQLLLQRKEAQAALSARKSTISKLEQKLTSQETAEKRCARLEEKLLQHERGTTLSELRNQVEDYAARLTIARARAERAEGRIESWKDKTASLQERNDQLESQLTQLVRERNALENTLEQLLTPDCNQCENSDYCSKDLDLCNRCVLFVGGRNRQCAHFRALVEKRNGEFIHHDGGLEESRQRLATLLARADMVLCPLDCISHDAMNRIKRDCKRSGTPLQILPQSSLAAFSRGLQEIGQTMQIQMPGSA